LIAGGPNGDSLGARFVEARMSKLTYYDPWPRNALATIDEDDAADDGRQSRDGGNMPAAASGAGDGLPQLMTYAEAGDYLRRRPRTIRRWVAEGALAPVTIGRAKYFRRDDIRALVARDMAARVRAKAEKDAVDRDAATNRSGAPNQLKKHEKSNSP